jgi:hypothetical protein
VSTHPLPSPAIASTAALDFKLLVESASDIIAVTDADTTIRYVSGAVERVLGYDPRALLGRRVTDLLAPESAAALAERLEPVAAGRSPSGEARTYEFVARDGSPRYLEVLATDQRANPRIGGLCVVARDITERVASERERAVVLERRRLAARVARVGLWEWDIESGEVYADDSVREILRQHEGQHWTGAGQFVERFLAADRETLAATMHKALTSGEPAACTARLQLPDGRIRWLHLHGQRMATNWGRPRVLGLVMDVSAQKRAEQELAERRDTLALASSAAGLLTWTWSPAEDVMAVDDRFAEVLGLPEGCREILVAQWRARVHPDDAERLLSVGRDLVEGRSDSFDVVYRLRRPEGGWRWILDRGRVAERDAEGRARRIYGVALDVDERQRAEAELAEQRVRLRLALDSARLGLWDWDRPTRRLVVDERFCEILGEPPEALAEEPFLLERLLREEDRQRVQQAIRSCTDGESSGYSVHGRLLRRDGRTVDVLMQGAVSGRSPDGRPSRLTGLLADVTETERARQLTRMSEEIAKVGSYEVDLVTGAIAWSEGTYRIFGMPASYQPDRESTVRLIAPSSRERIRTLFRAARRSGAPFDTELELRRGDGTSVYIRMTGRVENFEGRPVRLYGIAQDVSARKQLERELLEVANREQQRLGSELHDGLGQELAGVSMMLEALAQQSGNTQPALRAQLDRLRALITQSIASTRALAHGLAPVSLRRGGVESALGMLARQVEMTGGVHVGLDLAVEVPLHLDEVAGTHLYRIAQEAVGNALRHGSAQNIEIRLSTLPGTLELEITDDGSGVPAGGPAIEGFGLRSMRYRAQALEGTFSIGPSPGGGTQVRVHCPLRG